MATPLFLVLSLWFFWGFFSLFVCLGGACYSCPTTRVFIFRDVDAKVSANGAHNPSIRLIENGCTIHGGSAYRPGSSQALIFAFCFFYCTVKWRAFDDDTSADCGRSIIPKGSVCENS